MNRKKQSQAISIDIVAKPRLNSASCDLLKRATNAALAQHGVRKANICISIVDDAKIEELNRQHLGHKGPTDVLTFDLSDASAVAQRNGFVGDRTLDGEIVISRDTADREAKLRNHTLEAEIALYVIHGVLHLLGYDDCDESRSAAMHAMEDEILSSIGIGAVFARTPKSSGGLHSAAAKRK